MRPPWFTERLLDKFIDDDVSEDVLGDLAEEWHERAGHQGTGAASWWYRKQAAKSLVHLVALGWRPATVVGLIGAALVVGLPLFLFTGWAGLMTSVADVAMGMFGSGGGDSGVTVPLTRTSPAVWAAQALVVSVLCGFIGGLLLGSFSRKAGMVQVTRLAALCVPGALALQMTVPEAWPVWYGVTLPVSLTLCTFAGGIAGLRLRRSRRRPPEDGGTFAPGSGQHQETYRLGPERGLWQDFRLAARRLARSPRFTVTALAILGLGIGANTAVFSIIDAVYLDDPPHIQDLDRLVRVYGVDDGLGGATAMPYPDFAYYVENQRAFDGLMGWGEPIALTLGYSDFRQPARGMFVSHDYFDVLGVHPAAGRWFLSEEDAAGAPRMAAIVSHAFWSSALGADPDAVGQAIVLNGLTFMIVGVAPAGFAGPSPLEIPPDVWVPFHTVTSLSPRDWEMIDRPRNGGWNWVTAIGRLREGVSLDFARSDLGSLSTNLRATFPDQVNQGVALNADARFMPTAGGSFREVLMLMAIAAGAVLLAGTANVALLLLIRGAEATREVAVTKALGASGTRIARAALMENLLVGGLGAAVGVWISYAASGVAADLLPSSFSVSFEPDLTVLTFACMLALTVAVASGLVPALRTAQVDVNRALKGDERDRHGRSRMRSGLVVAQVAVAAALILAAALTTRSVASARAIRFGFELEGRTLLSTTLSNHGYSLEEGQVFVRETLERLRGLPGVRTASTMSNIPFFSYYSEGFRLPSDDATAANMGINAVSPDFFAAMGIELMAGRAIDDTDVAGGVPAIVVSATTAENLWPNQNPIGQRLFGRPDQPLWEVVGVAEDTRVRDLDRSPVFYGYTALAEDYRANVVFVVDGQTPVPLLRDTIYAIDPSVAISDVRSVDEVIRLVTSSYRNPALITNVLGAIALLLAVVGLYGVLSYTVSRERRTIGIRMALGASSRRVAWDVARQALGLVLLGLAIGGSGAWLAAPALRSFLYSVEPRDLGVWVTALLALFLIAAASSGLPARKAARIDPADALRRE